MNSIAAPRDATSFQLKIAKTKLVELDRSSNEVKSPIHRPTLSQHPTCTTTTQEATFRG